MINKIIFIDGSIKCNKLIEQTLGMIHVGDNRIIVPRQSMESIF